MQSINFEMLRQKQDAWASLGGFAEQYAHTDPSSALIKLRILAESMVKEIHLKHGFNDPRVVSSAKFLDLLKDEAFVQLVSKPVLDKFHQIRIDGNKAAHEKQVDSKIALEGLQDAWDLSRWFFVSYGGGNLNECPAYQEPETVDSRDKAALEKLAAQEAELQKALLQVEELQKQAEQARITAEELEAYKQAGQKAADELQFDEATTRKRLIDRQLAEAGWNLTPPRDGSRGEVSMEEPVNGHRTPSGTGYVDYVLWSDAGKPLAVIEAKKTVVDPRQGKKQAALYADALEEEHGQRPIIFYTNGHKTFIWDDLAYPPRELFGFYSKESLEYLILQRTLKKPISPPKINENIITGRVYQFEAIHRVCEKFTAQGRKALIVQATGTGKTRVAVALAEVLLQANWGKRVLFLCDRLELRKQAKNAFTEFLPGEPITYVTRKTAEDRVHRVYVSTYPAMMKIFQTFDPGFFDLIIADESHRSIYNRYRSLFQWFDSLQIGLTATPLGKINRNTFTLFECENQNPTAHYPLEEAIQEGHLVPYEVLTYQTDFLKEGIKYSNLTAEQKEELEDSEENPESFNYDSKDVDKKVANLDTIRRVLRTLMENGIKDASGQMVGKTIVFARNHDHAVLVVEEFNRLFPQYKGKVCEVIDYHNPRAEQLIDDFKDPNHELTIAVSVDMLDTGIDVPEVVNLVFARPVFSWVKFWQMIGRGTRLCKNLYGPGKDKKSFRIFDHWNNFERFEVEHEEADPMPSKPVMQKLFEARIDLAETALSKPDLDTFNATIELIRKDINSLPEETISVREKWAQVAAVKAEGRLEHFDPNTVVTLRETIAPLMQWVYNRDHSDAYDLDILVTNAQQELLNESGRFADFQDQITEKISSLQMHLNPVREKAEAISKAKASSFWEQATAADLEELRRELRPIMHHHPKKGGAGAEMKVIDVTDTGGTLEKRHSNLRSNDMALYRQEVIETLQPLFETSPVLQKIRRNEPVSEQDLESLTSLVLTQNPGVDLSLLREFYPDATPPLDYIIRTIVGMDTEAVEAQFAEFARNHADSSRQITFLRLLKNHIAQYGAITVDKLYEAPFIQLSSEGPDGVFLDPKIVDELIDILSTFQPQPTIHA
jgi:type I restriction enzyme R subunit